jgi:hypothetical protein
MAWFKWQSTCLASTRLRVQAPLQKKRKEKRTPQPKYNPAQEIKKLDSFS